MIKKGLKQYSVRGNLPNLSLPAFRIPSEDLTLTQKPSICSVKLNYENKNEPESLGIYFLIIMFANFVQDLLM